MPDSLPDLAYLGWSITHELALHLSDSIVFHLPSLAHTYCYNDLIWQQNI